MTQGHDAAELFKLSLDGIAFGLNKTTDSLLTNILAVEHETSADEAAQTMAARRLQPVDRLGGAVLLIRREVVQRIAPPWFAEPHETCSDADDFYFSAKVLEAGFELWAETDLDVGHITTTTVTPSWHPPV